MPIKTKKSLSDDLTEHIVTGSVTDKEMFNTEKEFYEHEPTKRQLWDLTEASMANITIEGMRQFIARSSRIGKSRAGGSTAVVVQGQFQFGLGRMAETFGEFESLPFVFRIFRSREKAITWLVSESDTAVESGSVSAASTVSGSSIEISIE